MANIGGALYDLTRPNVGRPTLLRVCTVASNYWFSRFQLFMTPTPAVSYGLSSWLWWAVTNCASLFYLVKMGGK